LPRGGARALTPPVSDNSALIATAANELTLGLGSPAIPGEVELELVISQISPLDRQVVAGFFPPAKPWPLIPGTAAVAKDADGNHYFAFAESVGGGLTRDGIHAQRFSLPQSALHPIPTGCDYVAIASAVTSLATARSILQDIAKVKSGDTLLILGGTGSVGQASIAVGRALGLTMAVASRDGADIDGVRGVRNDAIAEGARAILGRGADVIIDPVGGEITGNAMSAGAPDCKHILLGFSSGAMMPILAPKFLGGEHQLIGFNLLRRSHEGLAEHVRAAVQDVIAGGFAPEIDSIHPLADGVAAYAHAAKVRGRVLLQGSGA